jgi:hypothetical protein
MGEKRINELIDRTEIDKATQKTNKKQKKDLAFQSIEYSPKKTQTTNHQFINKLLILRICLRRSTESSMRTAIRTAQHDYVSVGRCAALTSIPRASADPTVANQNAWR